MLNIIIMVMRSRTQIRITVCKFWIAKTERQINTGLQWQNANSRVMVYEVIKGISWGGGCSPKKPVATSKSVNWHWLIFGFFGFGFGRNSKLEAVFYVFLHMI